MKKRIAIILVFSILLICIVNISYSYTPESDIFGTARNWIRYGKNNSGNINKTNWSDFNDLAGILWGAGVFVALIGGTILGIKYMFSSLEERANIKKSMMPYIIGTAIILGALTIWQTAVQLLENI